VSHTLRVLQELEHTSPIYLHTQTWSHAATRLYQNLGFEISTKDIDGSTNPDYQKALAILAELKTNRN
ncbi:MAG: GNAT family N-acetyltransferase, partial [Pisciglobus halotolerans]|nr:GNAT family N-acetyltransferase [Pisciglobus halotolerans]